MINVAVIFGGKSRERDVSLKTGQGIIRALESKGYNVKAIDYTSKDFIFELNGIDVVYIALHGKYGEDGKVQGLLEMLEIPYVGSGVLASALAMDKASAKKIFNCAGIRVAKDYLIRKEDDWEIAIESVMKELSFPIVVKPNQEGSTIGLFIVNNEDELRKAVINDMEYYDRILVEEYINGKEVTLAVLDDYGKVETLPIIEIVPNKNSYYDYESKYALGGSDHLIPARIDKNTEKVLKEWAVLAFKEIGCETLARVDFIVPSDGGLPVILEVNTLPGMTETSLYPDAAKSVGLSYEDIINKFIELTLYKYNSQK